MESGSRHNRSGGTGARRPYEWTRNLSYTEASGYSQGDLAEITTPLIALDDASLGYQLSFWYHMYGADMGTLGVLVDNGSGAVSICLYRVSSKRPLMMHG